MGSRYAICTLFSSCLLSMVQIYALLFQLHFIFLLYCSSHKFDFILTSFLYLKFYIYFHYPSVIASLEYYHSHKQLTTMQMSQLFATEVRYFQTFTIQMVTSKTSQQLIELKSKHIDEQYQKNEYVILSHSERIPVGIS